VFICISCYIRQTKAQPVVLLITFAVFLAVAMTKLNIVFPKTRYYESIIRVFMIDVNIFTNKF